jgi:hypothetical protein
MNIYLAGPMRGIPEFNFPAFDEAAARGRALGHHIISPADLDRDAGFSEKGQDGKVNATGHSETITLDFMRGAINRDVASIVGTAGAPGVDAVAMLPGWENSRGAKGERALAEWLGIPILDATTFAPFEKHGEIKNGRYTVKDSGAREQFTTGAVRDAGDGKGFFHCIPFVALEAVAKLYEAGAKKYAKDNWKKGIPLSRFLDSAFRHLGKLADKWTDEDHAAAVAWNVFGYIWTAHQIDTGKLPGSLATE